MRWLEVALAALLCSLASSDDGCPRGCSCMDGPEMEVYCEGTSLRGIKGQYVNVNCQGGKNISCALISWYSPRVLHLSACPPIPHCAGVEELSLSYPLEVEDQLKEVGGDIKKFTVRGERDAVLVPPSLFSLPSLTSLCLYRVSPQLPLLPAAPSSPLRTLELSDAALSTLPEGFLAALPNLTALRLWRNHFTEIPDQVFTAASLVNVSLSSNKLARAGCPPRARAALRSLSLFDNPLAELGPFTGCARLAKIDIFDTRQNTTISEFAFANLTELTSLTLRNCNLRVLPGNMFLNATSLQELFLNRNKLVTLPKHLLKDTKLLKKLDLSSNLLEVLEEDVFAEMKTLEELFLDKNKLKVLPDNLIQSSSSSLLVFSASHNLLSTLSSRLLRHCNRLKWLNLQYNMLREEVVPGYHNLETVSPFNSLTSVERVMLSHNQYSSVYRDFGTILLRMVSLQLDHNNIQDLDDYTELNFLQDHITVNLTHNLIHTIQLTPLPRSHTDSPISSKILIQDNPFHCDCSLYGLLASSKGLLTTSIHPDIILGNAMCATPNKFEGILLKDLKLEELTCDLPAEDCIDKCDCISRPHNMSLEITCPVIPEYYPDSGPYSVDLRINKSVSLVKKLSPNVRTLHLSGLAMKEVPIGDYGDVKHVDLRDNHLEYIPSDLFRNNLSLLLSGNPISCQCGDAKTIEELQRNSEKIKDYLLVSCGGGKGAISAQDPDGLCSAEKAVIAGVLFAAFGVIVGVVAVLLIKFKHYVKVILFAKGWCLCLVNEEELDKDRQYDAFISYCNEDKEFVLTKLLPGLESGPKPFKICVHERDWIAGEWIPAQIVRSVEQSRRTIIVLTNNFLNSLWSRLEFRAAILSSQNENRSRVIVILLEDISLNQEMDAELKAYLATNTYLKWGDAFFWERLRYALPHRKEEKIIRHEGKQLMHKVLQPQGGLHTELTPEGLIINAANNHGKHVKPPAAILPAKCHNVKDVKTPAIMAANSQHMTICVNDKQIY